MGFQWLGGGLESFWFGVEAFLFLPDCVLSLETTLGPSRADFQEVSEPLRSLELMAEILSTLWATSCKCNVMQEAEVLGVSVQGLGFKA